MRTEQDALTTTPNRLHPKQGEVIDRSATIRFTFDGVEYTAYPGDTVASALIAAGVKVLSRSFKYHRPAWGALLLRTLPQLSGANRR